MYGRPTSSTAFLLEWTKRYFILRSEEVGVIVVSVVDCYCLFESLFAGNLLFVVKLVCDHCIMSHSEITLVLSCVNSAVHLVVSCCHLYVIYDRFSYKNKYRVYIKNVDFLKISQCFPTLFKYWLFSFSMKT